MKISEATAILRSLGWSIYTDNVGDKVAHFKLSDRIVDIIYGIKKIRDQQKFGAMLSLSTDAFSEACSNITGDQKVFYPLIRAWKNINVSSQEIREDHIKQASDEAIDWAKEQDLKKALCDYADLPTDSPGARPVWHLSALALLGDITRLKLYQSSFEGGNRLGFVPYISKEYIDRAIVVADQYNAKHIVL